MSMTTFHSNGTAHQGYLVLPSQPTGRGVLVLHAWWGLNDFFRTLADRLGALGFVVFAPDLNRGQVAKTIDEAERIMKARDNKAAHATAVAALRFLQGQPAVQGEKVGAVGFSMGASFALDLDSTDPDAFAGIVLFYGGTGADVSPSAAQFQGHYGELDDWEPLEDVRKMAAKNLEVFTYPGIGHWFIEEDRPENYRREAADLAWGRTVEFLRKTLPE